MRTIFLLWCLSLARFAAAQQDYFVKFPDDIIWVDCPATPHNYGTPEVSNITGTAPVISFTDEMITVVPDACFRIERVWMVTSIPSDPMLPCIYVPNPTPRSILNHPENLPGPVVSPAGTAAPWAPTVVKVAPGDPAPTDFSTFWSATANCYQYKQTIKIFDSQDAVVTDCPAAPLFFEDETPNDGQFWNELYWLNPVTNISDLSEMPVAVSITATDYCSGANVSFRYQLFLDLDRDGVMETVIRSDFLPGAGQVNYFNAFNPNFANGTPRDFDQRPVPTDQKYRFGMQQQVVGSQRIATVGWNTQAEPNTWVLPQLPPGTHKIKWSVNDGCGNEAYCEYPFTISDQNAANVRTLSGTAIQDANANCIADTLEPGLKGWRARLEALDALGDPEITQYSAPNPAGKYFFMTDTGNYRLTVLPPNGYWESCPADTLLPVNSVGDTTEINFAMKAVAFCPFLETDIGIWGLRRCFDNTYTVRYCNTGTAPAPDAFVRVTLDPFMNFISAGLPGVDEGNHTWRFNLGDIPVGDCGSFPLTVYLDCANTALGQTHCVEAHIFPDSFCLAIPGWSGAQVGVDGACLPDSVCFNIRNTGTAPTALLDYIVIEDNIINFQGNFQLLPGDSLRICVPANGSTWRLEAEQEPGSPGDPMPSVTVEACGQNGAGGFSIGFVSQFGEADGDPFVSIDCQQNMGSYDPNDKQGFPLGYGPDHLIPPGRPLEYLIRFQNTGTDTAFQVIIRDTLSPWLDPATVVSGASSHPYRFGLSGEGFLTFTFDQILLPDSNKNEAASHGFVKFRVHQRPGTPIGSVINNRAAIYFDFNEPVLTNETQHTVGVNFIPTGVSHLVAPKKYPDIQVSPNPAPRDATLYLQNISVDDGRFELFDGRGQFQLSRQIAGNRVESVMSHLPSGIYYFKVSVRGQVLGMGKIVVP